MDLWAFESSEFQDVIIYFLADRRNLAIFICAETCMILSKRLRNPSNNRTANKRRNRFLVFPEVFFCQLWEVIQIQFL